MNSKAQVVILCGGKGARLREKTEEIPKPMVEIGDMPILWHIMKIYTHYGFKDFVLCLGYKGEIIRDFFVNFGRWQRQDFVLNSGQIHYIQDQKNEIEDWRIAFVDTGPETNTGGRIKRAEKHIQTNPFFVTYGDGLSNINIASLLKYHKSHGKMATMTCVKPRTQFGVLEVDKNNAITGYEEKPSSKQWVNGGFFVFNKDIFAFINENDTLEIEVLNRLMAKKELVGYPFHGFWDCMDTYKDTQKLNELWATQKAPWKVWGP